LTLELASKADEGMLIHRRNIVQAGLGLLASSPLAAFQAAAQDSRAFDLFGDDGKRVANYRLPSELSLTGLPGIVWTGSASPDVILIEFSDYNCPYCRTAASDLDALITKDSNFRLGLVNNAIIGLGSVQSAKVQQGVLKLYGPKRAYDFHKAMFAHRGANDGPVALEIAQSLGLDKAVIETAADGDDVSSVLKRQVKLASGLGFYATPSFMLNGVGILGYPGRESTSRMIAAVRKCDKLAC
jgi:protein-disulfide isomerase